MQHIRDRQTGGTPTLAASFVLYAKGPANRGRSAAKYGGLPQYLFFLSFLWHLFFLFFFYLRKMDDLTWV